jgi:hypothetical protein
MSDQVYVQIAENVDKGFQTAPKTDVGELSQAFIAYLKLLYTPEEAEIVQHLFMFPVYKTCLLYTSPSPRDRQKSRMPSSA